MLTNLLSLVRELGFAEKYQVSTFYRKYLLKVSMSSTPLIRSTMTCQGFYYFKELLRKKWKCKKYLHNWDLVCFLKEFFSKMYYRSLNLLPLILRLLSVEVMTPLQLVKINQISCLQLCLGGVLKLLNSCGQECWYIYSIMWYEFNNLSS